MSSKAINQDMSNYTTSRYTTGASNEYQGDACPLTSGHKGVATFSQDLHEVVGEITASQVQTHDGMRKGVALINGHVVGDTITRVKDNAYGQTIP